MTYANSVTCLFLLSLLKRATTNCLSCRYLGSPLAEHPLELDVLYPQLPYIWEVLRQ